MAFLRWAGLITTFLLGGTFLRDFRDFDLMESMAKRSSRFSKWAVLCICSLVLLTSSSFRFHEEYLELKIAMGVRVAVAGVGLIIMCELAYVYEDAEDIKSYSIIETETVMSLCSSTAYFVCVAYVTSDGRLGSTIGNLYYFSWFSLMASVDLALDCIKEITHLKDLVDDS